MEANLHLANMSHAELVAPVAEVLEQLDNRRCCLVVFDTLTATLQTLALPDGRTQEWEVAVVAGLVEYLQRFQKVHRPDLE